MYRIASEGKKVMVVRVADVQYFSVFDETDNHNQLPCNVCRGPCMVQRRRFEAFFLFAFVQANINLV